MDIAKICYISSKKTATEAVEGHKEELRLHRKVWSGFTKYIRSQCDKLEAFSASFSMLKEMVSKKDFRVKRRPSLTECKLLLLTQTHNAAQEKLKTGSLLSSYTTFYFDFQLFWQKYFSCPFIGKFGPVPDQDSETKRYRFVPSVDFIESASFKYEENDYNLSPFVDLKSEKVVVMSPSSIAQV